VIPLVLIHTITAPYVSTIHIRLPVFARASRELLTRWVQSCPPGTALEVTTLNPLGKPRSTVVTIGDLRPVSERFGLVNYTRDTTAENAARPWWRLRAVGKFNVTPGGETKVKEGWVWRDIRSLIERRTGRT
jgi:hypothetical protein